MRHHSATKFLCTFMTLVIVLSPMGWTAPEDRRVTEYRVRPGEGLARIARRFFGAPTYSKNGALSKMLELNPEISDPQNVPVGYALRLVYSAEIEKHRRRPASDENNEAQKSDAYSFFQALGGYRFVRLESKDLSSLANGILVSDSWIDFGVAWKQRWSEQFISGIYFTGSRASFLAPKNKSLDGKDFTLFGFGMNLGYHTNRSSYEFDMSVEQRAFLYAITTSVLTVGRLPVPRFKLSTDQSLIRLEPFSFGITGMASLELPAKHTEFDAKMGYGYGASAYIKEQFKSSELKANIGFQNIEQNTNLTKQKQLDLYLMLNYSIGIKSE